MLGRIITSKTTLGHRDLFFGYWVVERIRAHWRCPPFACPSVASIVVRGIFYWQVCKGIVAAYDPNTVEDQLWLIKLPLTTGHRFLILGESMDGLLQCGLDDYPGFKIIVLNRKLHCYSYSSIISGFEWTAKHIADAGDYVTRRQGGICDRTIS
ncbi:hypothetical protein L1049_011100 [Liquidambar formosana]|uniref:Uncharacterized protein n=1 Tax=Liquidambar formosana TaxID=63359 RepID=A0AAP0RWR9_LIQFO